MSGGALDYKYFQMIWLADELSKRIDEADFTYYDNSSKDERDVIMEEVRNLEVDLRKMADRVKSLEWWLSGDYGDKTYIKKIKEYGTK